MLALMRISNQLKALVGMILAVLLALLASGCSRSSLAPVETFEVPTLSNDEQPVPPCRYSRDLRHPNLAVSQSGVHFVLGQNQIYSLPLDPQTYDLSQVDTVEIMVDPGNGFTGIAVADNNDKLLVRSGGEGAFLIINGEAIEKVDLTSQFDMARVIGFSMSPNGEWLAIEVQPEYPQSLETIVILIEENTGTEIVLNESNKSIGLPSWSPTGDRIAYSIHDGYSSEIRVMDIVTQAISPVSVEGECHSNPVWAPDGKHLAFRTSETSYFTTSQLIVANLETGGREILLELTPYPDEDNPQDPEDMSLGFIDRIVGWSPSQKYIMVESSGFNPQASVCVIEVATKMSSCNWKTADLDFPFWIPNSSDDEIGLVNIKVKDPAGESTSPSNQEFQGFGRFELRDIFNR